MTPGDDSADKPVALKSPHEVIPLRNAARTYRISANRFRKLFIENTPRLRDSEVGFLFRTRTGARGQVGRGRHLPKKRKSKFGRDPGCRDRFSGKREEQGRTELLLFDSKTKSIAGIEQQQGSFHSLN